MTDFRNLEAYKQGRLFNKNVYQLLKNHPEIDRGLRDQFSRASTSILLNIAEGSGRFAPKDKKHFYVVSRASALECMAIVDILTDIEIISVELAEENIQHLDLISKMIFGIIRVIM